MAPSTGRHSRDGGARQSVSELLRSASAVAVLDRLDEDATDYPESQVPTHEAPAEIPQPRRGAGIVRLPTPRLLPTVEVVWPGRATPVDHPTDHPGDQLDAVPSTGELEALFAEPSLDDGPAPAGLVEPTEVPPAEPVAAPATAPEPEHRGRRVATTAVAIAGGALSLLAATVPVDALAGGYGTAALTTGTADTVDAVETRSTGADVLPAAADPGGIAASIAEAHQQVTDQVTAAEATLETARQKAVADAKAAADKAKADADKAKADAAVATQRACGVSESGLGAVKPFVRTAAQLLGCKYGKPTMYGVAGRGGVSDHPGGKAIDFMVDRGTGDELAACALKNKAALGITYVIWRQRINFGQGWQGMEDRGGVTANHYDHVHVSFGSGGKGNSLQGCT
jgi:hypothetical protein